MKPLNSRLSALSLMLSVVAMIVFLILVYAVPKLIHQMQSYNVPIGGMMTTLNHVSRSAIQGGWQLFSFLATCLGAAFVWRVQVLGHKQS